MGSSMIEAMKIISTILKTLGVSEEEINQAISGPLVPQPREVLRTEEPDPKSGEVRPSAVRAVPPSIVYLLLDISGSMDEGDKLSQAKRGGMEFAKDAIRRGYRVGVIQFSSWASLKTVPTVDLPAIRRGLTEIGFQASTNMASAIRLATEHLQSGRAARAMVLVTDGCPDSEAKAIAEAKKAKRQGITIITIGTDDADLDFLARIASAKGLSRKVQREELRTAITDAARLLSAKPK